MPKMIKENSLLNYTSLFFNSADRSFFSIDKEAAKIPFNSIII